MLSDEPKFVIRDHLFDELVAALRGMTALAISGGDQEKAAARAILAKVDEAEK